MRGGYGRWFTIARVQYRAHSGAIAFAILSLDTA